MRGGLFFGFWFFIMARPIFTQRQTHCSRRKTNYAGPAPLFAAQPIKVFCRGFFQKSRKVFFKRAGAKSASSRTASVTDFAWGRRLRLNGCLAACGPRFYEGCGPGSGLRPRKKARPTRAVTHRYKKWTMGNRNGSKEARRYSPGLLYCYRFSITTPPGSAGERKKPYLQVSNKARKG